MTTILMLLQYVTLIVGIGIFTSALNLFLRYRREVRPWQESLSVWKEQRAFGIVSQSVMGMGTIRMMGKAGDAQVS